ncbi:MAG: helix-turn-helix transcriptional regulator [Lachnospiraceae bacterium]|nr:helix-turn-helix transcriptional regulator [Lachnospiraceae bacterium]
MNIQELLKEKGISRYGLSKSSGIPWATLTDICSGKTHLERCTGATLIKLAA